MRKIRVLIVDDSVVIRKILSDALSADPAFEVVGLAANGKIGLAKISQVNPDAVTLDVEMPEMDGLTAVREIRKVWPKLPIVMFSTLCERGAAATMEALSRGASDYVTKPSNVGSVTEAIRRITTDLTAKLRALCGQVSVPATPPRVAAPVPVTPARAVATAGIIRSAVRLLAVGSSTGGPVALATFVGGLRDVRVPVIITQHMPPMFTRLLADRLTTVGQLKVTEARHGELAEPGSAYVAPGDFHLRVVRTETNALRLQLDQAPPENSCRPAVDVMFRSAAEACGSGVLGVVLTGMGQDGMLGARRLVEAGSLVLAQDEASSVVWGMPGAVVRDGLADKVLPIGDLAAEVNRRLGTVAQSAMPATPILRKGA